MPLIASTTPSSVAGFRMHWSVDDGGGAMGTARALGHPFSKAGMIVMHSSIPEPSHAATHRSASSIVLVLTFC